MLSGTVMAADLSADFTQGANNWETGQWNGWNVPHFNFNSNGAVVAQPWKKNTLSTSYAIDASAASYTFTFSTYATTRNQQILFYLTSSDYSVFVGNSYSSNAYVASGYSNKTVTPVTARPTEAVAGSEFFSFQASNPTQPDNRTVITQFDATNAGHSTGIDVGTNLNYTLTLAGTQLTIDVTDAANHHWSDTVTIKEGVTFDSIGFIIDGGTGSVGVKDFAVTVTPEPTTATLSLLALAGLCARRRRK